MENHKMLRATKDKWDMATLFFAKAGALTLVIIIASQLSNVIG